MKHILFFVIILIFCFVTYADDTDVLIDDLSSGTEIILDGDTEDNNEIYQEIAVDAPETEIVESTPSVEETLPGAEPLDTPVQEAQQPVVDTVETEQPIVSPQPIDSPETIYTVQLNAFKSRERAFAYHWKISKRISNTRVDVPSAKNKLYRVCCGTFPNYGEAKAKADKLKKQNVKCFITKTTPPKK